MSQEKTNEKTRVNCTKDPRTGDVYVRSIDLIKWLSQTKKDYDPSSNKEIYRLIDSLINIINKQLS